MRKLLFLLLLCSAAIPRDRNDALLGVVRVERDGKVLVAEVLSRSPALKAGLAAGDQLLEIDGKDIKVAADVDNALKALRAGDEIPILYKRGEKKKTVTAKLVKRGDFIPLVVRTRPRGRTGFEAPAWHIYAWSNVKKKGTAPTRENTKGKIVVIHCFQSW